LGKIFTGASPSG